MLGNLKNKAVGSIAGAAQKGAGAVTQAKDGVTGKVSSVTTGAAEKLNALKQISVIPTYDLPVYLVHTSYEEDDYKIMFDWEAYLTKAKGSTFVRPAFKIHSGREGFDRQVFATRFRKQFEDEYAYLIAKQEDQKKQKRPSTIPHIRMGAGFWLEAGVFVLLTGGLGLVPLITLWMGLGTANNAISFVNGLIAKATSVNLNPLKSKKDKIDVDAKKAEIDQALQRVEMIIHPELFVSAYGPKCIVCYPDIKKEFDALPEAWPMPDFVRKSLKHTLMDYDMELRRG